MGTTVASSSPTPNPQSTGFFSSVWSDVENGVSDVGNWLYNAPTAVETGIGNVVAVPVSTVTGSVSSSLYPLLFLLIGAGVIGLIYYGKILRGGK